MGDVHSQVLLLQQTHLLVDNDGADHEQQRYGKLHHYQRLPQVIFALVGHLPPQRLNGRQGGKVERRVETAQQGTYPKNSGERQPVRILLAPVERPGFLGKFVKKRGDD